MSIQLRVLEGIQRTMEDHRMQRCRFPYVHGRASFDVFFLADNRPFLLLFGLRGYPCSFDFPVNPLDFSVFPYMTKDDYFTLRAALGLDEDPADPGKPFSPTAFLKEFNDKVSYQVRNLQPVRPEDLVTYVPQVEEAEKRWFCGWRDNAARGERVTQRNLEKTRLLLGFRHYELCSLKNISSCWTADRARATHLRFP